MTEIEDRERLYEELGRLQKERERIEARIKEVAIKITKINEKLLGGGKDGKAKDV